MNQSRRGSGRTEETFQPPHPTPFVIIPPLSPVLIPPPIMFRLPSRSIKKEQNLFLKVFVTSSIMNSCLQ